MISANSLIDRQKIFFFTEFDGILTLVDEINITVIRT